MHVAQTSFYHCLREIIQSSQYHCTSSPRANRVFCVGLGAELGKARMDKMWLLAYCGPVSAPFPTSLGKGADPEGWLHAYWLFTRNEHMGGIIRSDHFTHSTNTAARLPLHAAPVILVSYLSRPLPLSLFISFPCVPFH